MEAASHTFPAGEYGDKWVKRKREKLKEILRESKVVSLSRDTSQVNEKTEVCFREELAAAPNLEAVLGAITCPIQPPSDHTGGTEGLFL